MGEVAPEHRAGAAGRERPREITRAASDVERRIIRTDRCEFHRSTTPEPVTSEAEQCIHQLVVRGDAVEHLTHAVGFVGHVVRRA